MSVWCRRMSTKILDNTTLSGTALRDPETKPCTLLLEIQENSKEGGTRQGKARPKHDDPSTIWAVCDSTGRQSFGNRSCTPTRRSAVAAREPMQTLYQRSPRAQIALHPTPFQRCLGGFLVEEAILRGSNGSAPNACTL